MKKSRKHRDSSDLSDEDKPAHKYSRHTVHHRDQHMTDDMAPHDRLDASNCHDQRKYDKHSRYRHEDDPHNATSTIGLSSSEDGPIQKNVKFSDRRHYKHSIPDLTRQNLAASDRQATTTHGHDANTARSDSSDEILIKHRASRRRPRNSGGDDIARQIKNIEKAQREALRPSSADSQEIHVHYVPIVTRSASPPRMEHDGSRPLSLAATDPDDGGVPIRKPVARGLSASDVKSQLKDLTLSWFTKRNTHQTTHTHTHRYPSSPRHSKHERRDKHGKKKVVPLASTSKYLAPLAQRWVCYQCGKVRSDSFQDRHPLRGGKKMQPNWCGKCRVHGELKGRPLDWNGQRHYCWGCGIVRSAKYHCENPIADRGKSSPNYCKRCRELSPSFERNLRETSEMGSEIDLRDQAFRRQMYDAGMSDIDEDDDHESTSAPGKENEDPNKPRKLKATKSFILKHGASTTKTCSDSSCASTSDGGGVPIDMLKAMHLDAARARGSALAQGEQHMRLSGGSYKPPSVQSLPSEEDKDAERQDVCALATDGGVSAAHAFDPPHERRSSSANKGCQTASARPAATFSASRPPRVSTAEQPVTEARCSKKTVRWSEEFSTGPATADLDPTTGSVAPQPYQSDSGFSSSGYRSDASLRSTGSARGRLRRIPPGEYSTGSPPRRREDKDDTTLADKVEGGHGPPSHQQHLPSSQGTFGEDVGAVGQDRQGPRMPVVGRGPTLSGYPGVATNPPTPPDSHDQPAGASTSGHLASASDGGRAGHRFHGLRQRKSSPDHQQQQQQYVPPNFSRPYESPRRGGTRGEAAYAYPAAETYMSSPGYGTRPDYLRQQQHQQQKKPRPPPVFPAFSSSTHFSDSTTRRDFSGYIAATDDNDAFYLQYLNTAASQQQPPPPDPDAGRGYYRHREHEWDVPFEGQAPRRDDYYHHQESGNEGNSAFDFSSLHGGGGCGGQTDTETKFVRRKKKKNDSRSSSSSNATTTNAPEHQTTTTPSPSQAQQWYLYDDEDDDTTTTTTFEMCGSHHDGGEGNNNYQWRDNGRTTIHRSGSTGRSSSSSDHNHNHNNQTTSSSSSSGSGSNHHHHQQQQPRNVVTILSIQEITSDDEEEEELSGCDEQDSPCHHHHHHHHQDEDAAAYHGHNDIIADETSDLGTAIYIDTPSTIR